MIGQHELIFGKKFLKKVVESTPGFTKFLNDNRASLTQPIKHWLSQLEQGIVKDEESFQDPFTDAIFKNVLGYTRQGDSTPWTCTREYKVLEEKSVDIALGFYEKGKDENQTTFVVGEYKSPAYKDLSRKPSALGMSPVDQAFNYALRVGIDHCHWIIVSNMDEIRLYHASSMEKYESFRIAELATNVPELERFYFLLSRQNLLPEKPSEKSVIDTLYDKNQADQADINKKFYAIYSKARQSLFEDLIVVNPEMDKLFLLEKVQKILDRFLFMCFCEDKGYIGNVGETDPLTKLIFVNALKSFTGSMWNEFLGIAKAIDKGAEKPIRIPPYDGGLFSPDPELEKLNVSNEAFAHLQPLAGYDYESELDVNILGHVFEQSVSDIEELKASINNEEFDKKKGKRKKQGIYYTPAYITGFIIEQTIGAWIEREKEKLGFLQLPAITEDEDMLLTEAENNKKAKLPKTLKEKASLHGQAWSKLQENLLNIKVLDPACGSGAFLNKAFWYLVKQHNQIFSQRQHYGSNDDSNGFDISRVDYHIIRNNLFGVDLSKESVEITKLSLWLQLVYHKEKLPSLEHSVHYGDSIVSDPNYSKAAFDWQKCFPNTIRFEANADQQVQDYGFDIVIGNPPYVRQEFLSPIKPALQNIYGDFYNGVADLYTYFYRRGFQLLKPDGYLGFITSSTFTKTGSGANLREFLKTEITIDRFVDFGDLQLFGEATNYPCIVIARNSKPADDHKVTFSGIEVLPDLETAGLLEGATQVENLQANLGTDAWNFDRPEVEALRAKIFSKGRPLKEIVGSPLYGIKTGLNEAFIIDKATKDRLIKEELELRSKQPHPNPLLEGEGVKDSAFLKGEGVDVLPPTGEGGRRPDEGVLIDSLTHNSHPLIKPFLVGRDLKQWHYDYQDRYLIFTRHGTDIDQYPAIKKYLEQFRERLEPKPLNLTESESRNWKGRKPGPYKWFEIQDNIAYYKTFEEPKIVYPHFQRIPKFCMDLRNQYLNNKGYIIPCTHWWLVSILQSRIVWRFTQLTCTAMRGGMWRYEMCTQFVELFPIVEPQGSEDDPSTDKGKLALLAKTAQEKAFKRLEYRKGFISFVNDLINNKSTATTDEDDVSEGSAINRWDTLSWNEFLKAGSSPSAFGKRFSDGYKQVQTNMALKKSFDELAPVCRQLTCEIHECEKQINEIVCRLYDLTPDEIKLLEELTGNIYED